MTSSIVWASRRKFARPHGSTASLRPPLSQLHSSAAQGGRLDFCRRVRQRGRCEIAGPSGRHRPGFWRGMGRPPFPRPFGGSSMTSPFSPASPSRCKDGDLNLEHASSLSIEGRWDQTLPLLLPPFQAGPDHLRVCSQNRLLTFFPLSTSLDSPIPSQASCNLSSLPRCEAKGRP